MKITPNHTATNKRHWYIHDRAKQQCSNQSSAQLLNTDHFTNDPFNAKKMQQKHTMTNVAFHSKKSLFFYVWEHIAFYFLEFVHLSLIMPAYSHDNQFSSWHNVEFHTSFQVEVNQPHILLHISKQEVGNSFGVEWNAA